MRAIWEGNGVGIGEVIAVHADLIVIAALFCYKVHR